MLSSNKQNKPCALVHVGDDCRSVDDDVVGARRDAQQRCRHVHKAHVKEHGVAFANFRLKKSFKLERFVGCKGGRTMRASNASAIGSSGVFMLVCE